jgi:antibiotic biosynthesis monooxygenase (ABM) superfamily enzyme
MATESGLLAVWTDVAPEAEAEFNEWYNTEHIPQLLGVPGFLSGRRYQAVDGKPKYLALYELTDENVLNGEAFLKVREHPTEWTRRMLPLLRNLHRGVFRQIFAHGDRPAQDAAFVLTVRLNTPPEHERDFNDWYNIDHVPALVGVPGVFGARRYQAVEGDPKYLAVYEMNDGAIPTTTAWEKARDSEWTRRIRPHLRDLKAVVARRILP